MIIDKLYYKSLMGMEWKKGGLSFVASYLSEFGSNMIAPKLGSSGYMVEKTYLQPVVSGALITFVKDDLTKLTTATSFFYLIDVFAR